MTGIDLSTALLDMLPRLWAFAWRLTGDQHDAEELVCRAFTRRLERAHEMQPDPSTLSWMISVIYSTWVSELQARRVRKSSIVQTGDDKAESFPCSADEDTKIQRIYERVVKLVEHLPEAQRIVILLVVVEGISYQQAAEILEVPIDTVACRLSRACAAVSASLGWKVMTQ